MNMCKKSSKEINLVDAVNSMSRLTLGTSGVTSGNRYNVATGFTHPICN
jgi:hypothetical protein